jgi:glycosyltransferase involved in cell wall biosynthesis
MGAAVPNPQSAIRNPQSAPVTVVLTCYNHARFVGDALGSVLAQTAPPERIVAVDDGSADGSADVLRRLAATDPAGRVEVVAQPNAGVCVARNRGADRARESGRADTEFLMFLDGDDRLAPRYIERTLAALRRRPRAAYAYTPFVWFGERSGVHPSLPYRADLLAAGNYIHNAALMRTAAFRRVGGFDLRWNRRGWEDWDLWLKFADAGLRGTLLDEPLLFVRALPGAHRNRTAERDAALSADLLSAHPRLVPDPVRMTLAKLLRRVWLTARGWAGVSENPSVCPSPPVLGGRGSG